jgi:hypothetical protein
MYDEERLGQVRPGYSILYTLILFGSYLVIFRQVNSVYASLGQVKFRQVILGQVRTVFVRLVQVRTSQFSSS